HDKLDLPLPALILGTVAAAFVGAQIGYFLGAKWGRRFFKPDARILKTAHLEKAEHYFTNYGGRSLVIGRFIPFVRTFIPLAAGIARYPYTKFVFFNTLGALLWGAGFLVVGALLGNVPFIHDNLSVILAVIIVVSVLPVVIEVVGKRRKGAAGQHIAGAE
ncbi:MAG: DedA family protein, partial [Schaalia georgiae]|nr:DedA family protein [Schaalia georgiae]